MQGDTRATGELPHPLLSSSHRELGGWAGSCSEACRTPKAVLSRPSHTKAELYFPWERRAFANLLHLGPEKAEDVGKPVPAQVSLYAWSCLTRQPAIHTAGPTPRRTHPAFHSAPTPSQETKVPLLSETRWGLLCPGKAPVLFSSPLCLHRLLHKHRQRGEKPTARDCLSINQRHGPPGRKGLVPLQKQRSINMARALSPVEAALSYRQT